jgi:V/A-type H+-transporting ATPase subunit D
MIETVVLVETMLGLEQPHGVPPPSLPCPEARRCGELHTRMLGLAARLAGVTGNCHRLRAEYRKTERRARALENVILPDLEQTLREMTARLEEMDFEDAVRVRLEYAPTPGKRLGRGGG